MRVLSLAAALFFLNASLTFQNVWPTPAVHWAGGLSVECAVCVLLLILWKLLVGPPSRVVLRVLATIWVVLVLGRYANVTAPALYGREISLYWDLQYIPDVAAMLAKAAAPWLVVLVILSGVFLLATLYWSIRWALGQLADAISHANTRAALAVMVLAVVGLFAGQRLGARAAQRPMFAAPVSASLVEQARLSFDVATGTASLPPSPSMASDLSRVKGADVVLLFLESYGRVTFDRPAFRTHLASSRAALDRAVQSTGRAAVSAFVESPTFGGSSWLAHLSLMSGVEVATPGMYVRLMTENRDTLATVFARHDYRTVAVMPGLWYPWPEGRFYRFDEIYGADRLAYRGPQFGWWGLSDQFALARLDEQALGDGKRQPVFVFFPTISTHTPFVPTPPYQPDWARMLTDQPYDAADVDRAFEQQPDWLDLGPSYLQAVSYSLTTIAGYLEQRPAHDLVLIVVGDHQPPALVAGEGQPWEVPVHIIASHSRRAAMLDRLKAAGFQPGVTPSGPALGKMSSLLPTLLEGF